ncbi:DNA-binding protein, partial [bacterium]|nr:DNA-binding protein [bacterium]
MKQSKILLDTCSYLRLAKSIHPLLNQTFGNDHYCLYVIEEFQKEYDKNLRLRNKFAWVNDTEYVK